MGWYVNNITWANVRTLIERDQAENNPELLFKCRVSQALTFCKIITKSQRHRNQFQQIRQELAKMQRIGLTAWTSTGIRTSHFQLRELGLYRFTFSYQGNVGMSLWNSTEWKRYYLLLANIGNIRLFSVYSYATPSYFVSMSVNLALALKLTN